MLHKNEFWKKNYPKRWNSAVLKVFYITHIIFFLFSEIVLILFVLIFWKLENRTHFEIKFLESFIFIFGFIISLLFSTALTFLKYKKEWETKNSIRDEIFYFIEANPGIHFSQIQRKLNLANGQLHWHLNILLKYGFIQKQKHGQFTLYFSNFYEAVNNLNSILLQKSPSRWCIFQLIQESPGITQKEIQNSLHCSQSSISYHLKKLLELLLVETRFNSPLEKGINKYYLKKPLNEE